MKLKESDVKVDMSFPHEIFGFSSELPKETNSKIVEALTGLKANYFVSYVFKVKDAYSPTHYHENCFGSVILQGNINEATKEDLLNWISEIMEKESDSAYEIAKVTILFFKKLMD